jgi:hypothetical protein
MTKWLYTAEKVLEAVLEDPDDDQDYDDPDEPVMEGSDEEFSELNEDDGDGDIDLPPLSSPLLSSSSTPAPLSPPSPPSSTSNSPPSPATWTSTLTPVQVKHSPHQWVQRQRFPNPPERSSRCSSVMT